MSRGEIPEDKQRRAMMMEIGVPRDREPRPTSLRAMAVRPLESVYAFVYVDALIVKVKSEGKL